MSIYLNSSESLELYKMLYNTEYFVDKSEVISKLNKVINTTNRYVCVTRPRRFGKSCIANMIGAYYTKENDSREIFSKLKINNDRNFENHLNKYNLVYINFNEIPDNLNSYEEYINNIITNVKIEIMEMFSSKGIVMEDSLKRAFEKTEEKFIFVFDEWDYIFNNNLFEENQNDYLEFLRNLLKDKAYVLLCYMTGVLPIKRYSSGSALNMFDEFTMLSDSIFGENFGFTENEVINICNKQNKISFEEISEWYNGYVNENGDRVFNPRSVVKALYSKKCKSYWTNTGAMEEVSEILKYNILEVRDDVIEMVSGNEIDITIDEEFRAGQGIPKTKEEIYSAMIVLGFLSYYDGYLKIPNKELMKEFEKALKDESFGYVSEIIENSKKMLKATTNGEEKIVEEILHDIHNSEIPILQYNDENSLSCVLTLAYLSARDTYRVEREEKTGKGYADFTFHPRRKNDIPFIVELKKDVKPEIAIRQIREKEYVQKFRELNKDKKILAVAICYDSKEKEHKCIIEKL